MDIRKVEEGTMLKNSGNEAGKKKFRLKEANDIQLAHQDCTKEFHFVLYQDMPVY